MHVILYIIFGVMKQSKNKIQLYSYIHYSYIEVGSNQCFRLKNLHRKLCITMHVMCRLFSKHIAKVASRYTHYTIYIHQNLFSYIVQQQDCQPNLLSCRLKSNGFGYCMHENIWQSNTYYVQVAHYMLICTQKKRYEKYKLIFINSRMRSF